MANDQELYAFPMKGFWADIGKPKDFLIGVELFLNDLYEKEAHHELFTPMSDMIEKNFKN